MKASEVEIPLMLVTVNTAWSAVTESVVYLLPSIQSSAPASSAMNPEPDTVTLCELEVASNATSTADIEVRAELYAKSHD